MQFTATDMSTLNLSSKALHVTGEEVKGYITRATCKAESVSCILEQGHFGKGW